MKHFVTIVLLFLSSCVEGSNSFVIQPKSWDYKGHEIGYEVSQKVYSDAEMVLDKSIVVPKSANGNNNNKSNKSNREPILLLNGFGVGSFHQHRLIERLLVNKDIEKQENDDGPILYCIDYLGQGRSWPRECQDGMSPTEKGLIYSAETWIDQVIRFIEQVILPEHPNNGDDDDDDDDGNPVKVHLVGNSVGGHLAAHLANLRPDLIQSICLLNPTPVWGLNLPGWSGHLPAPAIPKRIGRYLFDRIRDLKTIETYLESAYARREAFGEELMHQIRGCTLGNGGHAAFASILWSPPLEVSPNEKGDFQECLARLQCDVLLIFGREDPWCKPAFAKKMLQALCRREPTKVHRYVELENVGHCPNHEAPQAVAQLVSSWVNAQDRAEEQLTLVKNENMEVIHEEWGEIVMRERSETEIPLSLLDRIAMTFV